MPTGALLDVAWMAHRIAIVLDEPTRHVPDAGAVAASTPSALPRGLRAASAAPAGDGAVAAASGANAGGAWRDGEAARRGGEGFAPAPRLPLAARRRALRRQCVAAADASVAAAAAAAAGALYVHT